MLPSGRSRPGYHTTYPPSGRPRPGARSYPRSSAAQLLSSSLVGQTLLHSSVTPYTLHCGVQSTHARLLRASPFSFAVSPRPPRSQQRYAPGPSSRRVAASSPRCPPRSSRSPRATPAPAGRRTVAASRQPSPTWSRRLRPHAGPAVAAAPAIAPRPCCRLVHQPCCRRHRARAWGWARRRR